MVMLLSQINPKQRIWGATRIKLSLLNFGFLQISHRCLLLVSLSFKKPMV